MVGNCIELFRSGLLTSFLRFISFFGDGVWIPVILTIIVAMIFWFRKEKAFAITLAIAPLVGQIVKSLLKNYFQIPRPEAFGCNVLTTYADKYSFPSGHVIFYTVFFGLLAYWAWENRKGVYAWALLAVSSLMILLVGYSRIYLGAHWHLDIIGGYVVGGAILTVAILLYEYWERKNVNR